MFHTGPMVTPSAASEISDSCSLSAGRVGRRPSYRRKCNLHTHNYFSFYPASGRSSGLQSNPISYPLVENFVHASTIRDLLALGGDFYLGGAVPAYAAYRTYGNSVRCVREIARQQ